MKKQELKRIDADMEEPSNPFIGDTVGFVLAIQLFFLTLKITEAVAWKWIWVVSPTWIGAIIVLITILCLHFRN